MATIFADAPANPSAAVANRRRLLVFAIAFVLAAVASLSWVFSRPAEYEATARWQFDFPSPPSLAASAVEGSPPFDRSLLLTEVQVLTSRPLIEQLLAALRSSQAPLPELGADAPAGLQRMLEVSPQPGTAVVELRARGAQAQPLAPALNALFEVYRAHLGEAYRDTSDETLARAREEARQLEQRVQQRRQAVDAFRARYDIVSLERDENTVLAQVRGQGQSMTLSNDKVVAAEGRLRALQDAMAAGKSVARARDNPTLASLEQRLSHSNEELRELQRRFTEAYLAMDPGARALRARIGNLEEQLRQAREDAARAAIAEAEEEVASTRAAAARLAQQVTSNRQNVQTFTARLAEYKAMAEELARLEGMHSTAQARVTELESAGRLRAPTVRLLEPASPPTSPSRPLYARDAALALAGSLLFALLAMGIVELFNRPEPAPALVVERRWMPASLTSMAAAGRPLMVEGEHAPHPQLPPLVPALGAGLPRELADAELEALLAAAPAGVRPALTALLCGIDPQALAALLWRDVDLARGTLRIGEREMTLPEPLRAVLATLVDATTTLDARVFAVAPDDLDAQTLIAAHDAGLERAGEVTVAALRHTFIAHLVRQGLRFAELTQIVGALAPEALNAYGALAPPGPKRPLGAIDPVLPALRRLAAGGVVDAR